MFADTNEDDNDNVEEAFEDGFILFILKLELAFIFDMEEFIGAEAAGNKNDDDNEVEVVALVAVFVFEVDFVVNNASFVLEREGKL